MRTPGALFRPLVVATLTAALAGAAFAADDGVKQTVGPGAVDWTKQTLSVTGSGVPPAGKTGAQARLLAERAAQVEAYRQLAEVTNGVQVTAETNVKDFVVESDVIRTQVQATIKGARRVGKPRYTSDGAVEIDLEMPLFGASGSLADAVDLDSVVEKQADKQVWVPMTGWMLADAAWFKGAWPLAVVVAAGGNTGLIIDAADIGAEPAMGPVVIGGSKKLHPKLGIDKKAVVAEGPVHYVATMDAAKGDTARVGDNPLVVKAKSAAGKSRSDLILDEDTAGKIAAADAANPFLKDAKVAVVL